ncbi:PRPF3 [Lepeophtheirus salmonis]|uniref:PRPF3 n=1 Tax=Lepeophtheirus salmonis TaxID=72036 RepID=A0A7R8CXU9_LEPSM|nr:PRPF3 [Lepeophtheirus salmonis]CAF2965261.1 PRPF3 [Lepeophtheirus salmonis]
MQVRGWAASHASKSQFFFFYLLGRSPDRIIIKLATLLDYKKAEKLASRIWDVVDDFCISRELTACRKRALLEPESGLSLEEEKDVENKEEPSTKKPSLMTPEQIRSMINGSKIPPPGVAAIPPAPFIDQKAKTIAALQAQIASKMEKMKEAIKPQGLILNDKGRMVDTSELKKRDEMKDSKDGSGGQQKIEANQDPSIKFFDPRLSKKTVTRNKKVFSFHEPGKFQIEGNRMRMKAQLERLQAGISTTARKTGITSAAQLAKLVPKGDGKDRVP